MLVKKLKTIFILGFTSSILLLTSCASTKIVQEWVEPEQSHNYQQPMIIGISDSQQTRRVYEDYFVKNLKRRNITATPSHTLINSKQKITRETVVEAIRDTDIDAVLVTYLVSNDVKLKHQESPVNGNYTGDTDNMMSDTLISTRGRSRSSEVIVLKSDLYDAKTKSIVWSVQTKTVAPESIDDVVIDVTNLLIDKMFSDGILK